MLRSVYWTARQFLFGFVLAVFFSGTALANENSLTSLETDLSELVYSISGSIVTVEASQPIRLRDNNFIKSSDQSIHAVVASGIVYDSLGRILVSASTVIGRETILIRSIDMVVSAKIIAIDYQSELALLQCSSPVGKPAVFSSLQTCAGQMVLALGNAYGIRSAPSLGFCAGLRDDGAMQFSIALNSGNVGGGIFDLSGQLLGIITGSLGQQKGVTLALPAYQISSVVNYLLNYGDRLSGFVGIKTKEIEISPGLPVKFTGSMTNEGVQTNYLVERGLLVTSIVPDSPANRAGLIAGDLIFAFGDIAANSAVGLASLVRQAYPGTRINIEIIRDNKQRRLSLVIGKKSGSNLVSQLDQSNADNEIDIDSLHNTLENLKKQMIKIERQLQLIH